MWALGFALLFGLGVDLVGRLEAKPVRGSWSPNTLTGSSHVRPQLYDARYLATTARMEPQRTASRVQADADCSLGSVLDFYRVHLSDIRTRVELSKKREELAAMADELDQLSDLLRLQASSCPDLVAPLELIDVSIKSIGVAILRVQSQ